MRPQRLDRVLTCYRIGDPEGRFSIYDAEGSRLAPGRWNTAETPLIYTSEHYSTAMLEKLVHGSGALPPNRHFIRITIPNGVTFEMVTPDLLPDWASPDRDSARRFGSAWASALRSTVLIVPSYVSRGESNILINPRHPEAAGITCELPVPVWWDNRLFDAPDI